jgi:glycogen operon protein
VHLRRDHPNLHRRKFFQDRVIRKTGGDAIVHDLAWFGPDGQFLPNEAWSTEWNRSLAIMLNGNTLQVSDEEGRPVVDDSFLLVVNAAHEGVEFTLPPTPNGGQWGSLIDTENIEDPFATTEVGNKVILGGRSMMVLTAPQGSQTY